MLQTLTLRTPLLLLTAACTGVVGVVIMPSVMVAEKKAEEKTDPGAVAGENQNFLELF